METLPIASFVVDGAPHPLVAGRLSAEFAIGVRHGCFCTHPYLVRLLELRHDALERLRAAARRHDRSALPGAVRAPTVEYARDARSGDYLPAVMTRPDAALGPTAGCQHG